MAAQCVEFLSTLSLRRATTGHGSQGGAGHRFLSTLSLRRATMPASWIFATPTNFYPRSPCGERPHRSALCGCLPLISIHALLAESDVVDCGGFGAKIKFLSTLSLRRATARIRRRGADHPISIHALLAESDCASAPAGRGCSYFYPRSPCGERPGRSGNGRADSQISIHALLAESDTRF